MSSTAVVDQITSLIATDPPKAASLIVTIYGDVVEPRGGVLWMGNLIMLCAAFGLSETHVRTAVSRLAYANQLAGERAGRKSYYRLTDTARAEYLEAARVLFYDVQEPNGWRFVFSNTDESSAALSRSGFAQCGPQMWIGPCRGSADPSVLTFETVTVPATGDLSDFGQRFWDLDGLADAYRGFISRFSAFEAGLAKGKDPIDKMCLIVRLALVHAYRAIVLKDPRLPDMALPVDWPGHHARSLFARLYVDLSPKAETFIHRHLETADGALPRQTEKSRQRLESLAAMADCAQQRPVEI